MKPGLTGLLSSLVYNAQNNDHILATIRDDMTAMEGRLNERIDRLNDRIDTTNENMSAQFAAQKKFISDEIDKRLNK